MMPWVSRIQNTMFLGNLSLPFSSDSHISHQNILTVTGIWVWLEGSISCWSSGFCSLCEWKQSGLLQPRFPSSVAERGSSYAKGLFLAGIYVWPSLSAFPLWNSQQILHLYSLRITVDESQTSKDSWVSSILQLLLPSRKGRLIRTLLLSCWQSFPQALWWGTWLFSLLLCWPVHTFTCGVGHRFFLFVSQTHVRPGPWESAVWQGRDRSGLPLTSVLPRKVLLLAAVLWFAITEAIRLLEGKKITQMLSFGLGPSIEELSSHTELQRGWVCTYPSLKRWLGGGGVLEEIQKLFWCFSPCVWIDLPQVFQTLL